jgi:hypothetical protein
MDALQVVQLVADAVQVLQLALHRLHRLLLSMK